MSRKACKIGINADSSGRAIVVKHDRTQCEITRNKTAVKFLLAIHYCYSRATNLDSI